MAGYDAAVGLGEVVEQDMLVVRVSDQLRMAVVGAPVYFERHPVPEHPRDLTRHECINWKAGPADPPYRWELTENGRDFSVSVDARVVTTDPDLNIGLAVAGVGLTIALDRSVRQHIEAGELVRVLGRYSPPFPGYYLYFPRRRQRPPVLRAFIEHVRGVRS